MNENTIGYLQVQPSGVCLTFMSHPIPTHDPENELPEDDIQENTDSLEEKFDALMHTEEWMPKLDAITKPIRTFSGTHGKWGEFKKASGLK